MTSIPHDYHLHTTFSIDCETPMAAMCERAIALGIPEICVTDHVDWVPKDVGRDYFRPAPYFEEVEVCRARYDGRLTLLAGAEMSEVHRFPDEARALTSAWPFDFVIGSLHWVGDEVVLAPDYFTPRSAEAAYAGYFQELERMVRAGGFDIVGHLDVLKRDGFDVHGRYTSAGYAEPIRAVLRACVESGIGIEINTSTLRRAVAETSPALDVLRWYRELGGDILTLGSDAHRPEHLAYRFDLALEMARAAGFRRLTCFRGRVPRSVGI
jgi:histidinol-phosphatase (PHP family)